MRDGARYIEVQRMIDKTIEHFVIHVKDGLIMKYCCDKDNIYIICQNNADTSKGNRHVDLKIDTLLLIININAPMSEYIESADHVLISKTFFSKPDKKMPATKYLIGTNINVTSIQASLTQS